MQRLSRKLALIPAILSLILAGVLTSCRTCPPSAAVEPLPIAWPSVPDPAGKVALAGDVVSMPLAYWLSVTRYVIDVEAGIDEVKAARAVKE